MLENFHLVVSIIGFVIFALICLSTLSEFFRIGEPVLLLVSIACAIACYFCVLWVDYTTKNEKQQSPPVTSKLVEKNKPNSRFSHKLIPIEDPGLSIKEIIDHKHHNCYLLFMTRMGTAVISEPCPE